MTYENLGLRLPEIGRVKIGQKGKEQTSKKGKKFRLPEKLDHFRICTLIRGEDSNLLMDEAAHKILGEKPRKLTVRPISSKLVENIQAGFALYSKSGERLCHGNGQEAIDDQTGEVKSCPCIEYEENRCKKFAKANFFLDKVGGVGGVHTMTIRGKITVPALVGSLKFLTEVCESGGGSVAGVPLELRLNEVMTRYGKVYSPYFLFPGSTEELIAAAQKSAGLKFQVLGEEGLEDADDTEEEEVNTDDSGNKSGKNMDQVSDSESKPESQAKENKPTAKAAKSNKDAGPAANSYSPDQEKKENKSAAKADKASKPLKAFWCDSCYKIANDYVAPGVCSCGNKKFNEAKNMKAAQAAITKRINKKEEGSKKPELPKMFFWCRDCGNIIKSTLKPKKCDKCESLHFSMEKTEELAKKAWQEVERAKETELAKKAWQDTQEQKEPKLDNKKLKIAENIKEAYGSSTPQAVCKRISLLLDRKIESSSEMTSEEVDALDEVTAIVASMDDNESREQFISDWKKTKSTQQEQEAAA